MAWRCATRLGRSPEATAFPPISVLKPVHGAEPEADAEFRSYCTQLFPSRYEVLFSFEDAAQPLLPVAKTLADEFPAVVRCLLSGPVLDPLVNGKSHNLATGAATARYEWLLVSARDTVADAATLRRLVAPLADPRVRAIAATPRVMRAHGLPARLERLLVNVLMAGFEYAAAQVRGAYGVWDTLLLVHREGVAAAGGYAGRGPHLAEDIALEEALHRQGYGGALVRRPVDVQCAKMTVGQRLQHWHRWLVRLRAIKAGGWTSMGIILLACLLPVAALASLALLPGAAVERLLAIAILAAAGALSMFITCRAGIGVREPAGSYLLLTAAITVVLAAFCRSAIDRTVVWRGRRLRVGKGRRLQPLNVGPPAPVTAGRGE